MKEEPENSAANHLWIHAVEPARTPNRRSRAEILGSLAPASDIWSTCRATSFTVPVITRVPRPRSMLRAGRRRLHDQQQVAVDNDWNYIHNLMYSVANLLEAGRLQEAAKSGKTWRSPRSSGDTL